MQFSDRALTQLTKSVEPQFDMATGQIKLKASIAAHANIGPYEFRVEADSPNHLKATHKPKPFSGIVQYGKGRYKFSAEIAFKIDVTLHPMNRNNPAPVAQQKPLESKKNSSGIIETLTVLGLIVASAIITIFGPKGNVPTPKFSPASSTPFLHNVDPNDPRLQT